MFVCFEFSDLQEEELLVLQVRGRHELVHVRLQVRLLLHAHDGGHVEGAWTRRGLRGLIETGRSQAGNQAKRENLFQPQGLLIVTLLLIVAVYRIISSYWQYS